MAEVWMNSPVLFTEYRSKIAVFHEGQVVRTGGHVEPLADTEDRYYQLWNAQAGLPAVQAVFDSWFVTQKTCESTSWRRGNSNKHVAKALKAGEELDKAEVWRQIWKGIL